MTWLILGTALKEMYPRLREDKRFKLSVNVTPRHLLSDGFVETLRRVVVAAQGFGTADHAGSDRAQ